MAFAEPPNLFGGFVVFGSGAGKAAGIKAIRDTASGGVHAESLSFLRPKTAHDLRRVPDQSPSEDLSKRPHFNSHASNTRPMTASPLALGRPTTTSGNGESPRARADESAAAARPTQSWQPPKSIENIFAPVPGDGGTLTLEQIAESRRMLDNLMKREYDGISGRVSTAVVDYKRHTLELTRAAAQSQSAMLAAAGIDSARTFSTARSNATDAEADPLLSPRIDDATASQYKPPNSENMKASLMRVFSAVERGNSATTQELERLAAAMSMLARQEQVAIRLRRMQTKLRRDGMADINALSLLNNSTNKKGPLEHVDEILANWRGLLGDVLQRGGNALDELERMLDKAEEADAHLELQQSGSTSNNSASAGIGGDEVAARRRREDNADPEAEDVEGIGEVIRGTDPVAMARAAMESHRATETLSQRLQDMFETLVEMLKNSDSNRVSELNSLRGQLQLLQGELAAVKQALVDRDAAAEAQTKRTYEIDKELRRVRDLLKEAQQNLSLTEAANKDLLASKEVQLAKLQELQKQLGGDAKHSKLAASLGTATAPSSRRNSGTNPDAAALAAAAEKAAAAKYEAQLKEMRLKLESAEGEARSAKSMAASAKSASAAPASSPGDAASAAALQAQLASLQQKLREATARADDAEDRAQDIPAAAVRAGVLVVSPGGDAGSGCGSSASGRRGDSSSGMGKLSPGDAGASSSSAAEIQRLKAELQQAKQLAAKANAQAETRLQAAQQSSMASKSSASTKAAHQQQAESDMDALRARVQELEALLTKHGIAIPASSGAAAGKGAAGKGSSATAAAAPAGGPRSTAASANGATATAGAATSRDALESSSGVTLGATAADGAAGRSTDHSCSDHGVQTDMDGAVFDTLLHLHREMTAKEEADAAAQRGNSKKWGSLRTSKSLPSSQSKAAISPTSALSSPAVDRPPSASSQATAASSTSAGTRHTYVMQRRPSQSNIDEQAQSLGMRRSSFSSMLGPKDGVLHTGSASRRNSFSMQQQMEGGGASMRDGMSQSFKLQPQRRVSLNGQVDVASLASPPASTALPRNFSAQAPHPATGTFSVVSVDGQGARPPSSTSSVNRTALQPANYPAQPTRPAMSPPLRRQRSEDDIIGDLMDARVVESEEHDATGRTYESGRDSRSSNESPRSMRVADPSGASMYMAGPPVGSRSANVMPVADRTDFSRAVPKSVLQMAQASTRRMGTSPTAQATIIEHEQTGDDSDSEQEAELHQPSDSIDLDADGDGDIDGWVGASISSDQQHHQQLQKQRSTSGGLGSAMASVMSQGQGLRSTMSASKQAFASSANIFSSSSAVPTRSLSGIQIQREGTAVSSSPVAATRSAGGPQPYSQPAARGSMSQLQHLSPSPIKLDRISELRRQSPPVTRDGRQYEEVGVQRNYDTARDSSRQQPVLSAPFAAWGDRPVSPAAPYAEQLHGLPASALGVGASRQHQVLKSSASMATNIIGDTTLTASGVGFAGLSSSRSGSNSRPASREQHPQRPSTPNQRPFTPSTSLRGGASFRDLRKQSSSLAAEDRSTLLVLPDDVVPVTSHMQHAAVPQMLVSLQTAIEVLASHLSTLKRAKEGDAHISFMDIMTRMEDLGVRVLHPLRDVIQLLQRVMAPSLRTLANDVQLRSATDASEVFGLQQTGHSAAGASLRALASADAPALLNPSPLGPRTVSFATHAIPGSGSSSSSVPGTASHSQHRRPRSGMPSKQQYSAAGSRTEGSSPLLHSQASSRSMAGSRDPFSSSSHKLPSLASSSSAGLHLSSRIPTPSARDLLRALTSS